MAWLSSLSHPPCAKTTIIKDTKVGKSISALSRLTAVSTCPMKPTQPALQNHVTWVQCVQCGKIHFFKPHPHTSTRSPSQMKPEQSALQNHVTLIKNHADEIQRSDDIKITKIIPTSGGKSCFPFNITKTCVVETLPLKYTSKRLKRRETKRVRK